MGKYSIHLRNSPAIKQSPCTFPFWITIGIVLLVSPFLEGATLQPQTIKAFSRYIENVEKELNERGKGELPFLRVQESPGNLISLDKELVIIRNLYENDDTPKGIIHDWLGATVLEGISLDRALEIITDYKLHERIFDEIVLSEPISSSGDLIRSHMRFKKEGIVTVITDSIHESRIHRISDKQAQVFCRSLRVNEIENWGQEDERLLPEGNDRGILWKLNSYISLEEIEDGVIIECRSINLTRDLPFGIGLFIGRFIRNLPPESLDLMLHSLRAYIENNPEAPELPRPEKIGDRGQLQVGDDNSEGTGDRGQLPE